MAYSIYHRTDFHVVFVYEHICLTIERLIYLSSAICISILIENSIQKKTKNMKKEVAENDYHY